jgi:hypothetical protein
MPNSVVCGLPVIHGHLTLEAFKVGVKAQLVRLVLPLEQAQKTAQEFRRSVKRDIAHYPDLKDDKRFRIWNRGFVSKAKMHHTHLV